MRIPLPGKGWLLFWLASMLALVTLWLLSSGATAFASPAAITCSPDGPAGDNPAAADAYAHWVYNGSSPTEITITVGTQVPLDLYINTGSNQDATGQQSYLTFDYSLFRFVNSAQQGCVLTSTVVLDAGVFDAALQNEICNGPDPCTFHSDPVDPGSFAFASGALINCPNGCGGDFRVARSAICGLAPGRGVLHWQFSPPAPLVRDSEIINLNSEQIQNPTLYHDLYVNVVAVTPVPTRTSTPTTTATPAGSATPCAMGFTDVYGTDYFYDAVRYLYCEGAISGYSDGTFRPYNNTTRGQLSKIIVLAQGWPIDTSGGPHFSDVLPGSAFYDYVETAYNHGIISGYSDGTFQPGNNVTRGQLSKIVVLAKSWTLVNRSAPTFSDVPVGSTFFAYVETAYCHGIISGYSDGTFRPGNNATRGQISKIVYLAETGSTICSSR